MSIKLVMPSNHLILCRSLLLLPLIFPAIRVLSKESVLPIRRQSKGASASALALSMDIQDWFPFRLTSLISLLSTGISRVFSNTTVQKHQFFSIHKWIYVWSNSHIHVWLLEKAVLSRRTFVGKVMSLFFNILSRLAPFRWLHHSCSHHQQWFWSPNKYSVTVSIVYPSICHEVMGLNAMILVFTI